MSRLEELKNILKKLVIVPQEWLEETTFFNLLKEKYQNLPLFKQKIIKFVSLLIPICLILFIPLSFFLSSLKYETELKEKQSMILKLLRLSGNPNPPFTQLSQLKMKKRISDVITKYQRQNYTIQNKYLPQNKKSKLKQVAFKVQVNHLNIKIITQIGEQLKQLPFAKMQSLKIQENIKYENHYNATYVISFFLLPSVKRSVLRPESKKFKKKQKPLKTKNKKK